MFRIGKLTDYAIVLLTTFVREPRRVLVNARDLATETQIPSPTVNKILRALSRSGLLISQRGVKGGFALARSPEAITIADVIAAMEGPVTMTECSGKEPGLCELEPQCPVRSNWMKINHVVSQALHGLTLREMALPMPQVREIGRPGDGAAARSHR